MLGRHFLQLLAVSTCAFAGVHELWWNITYVEDANPDGLYERRVIGVNGTWPPPPISVDTSDSLLLHVSNGLDQPTTMHHHGMFFNSTSWMDGALSVSQCGIPPGQTFDYVVPINTSEQYGTYWAHAHAGGQYVDGLRTPLVLHPPKETYQYDEEFTVVLGDWYHQEHEVLMKQFINIANPGGAEPVPDSALIYFAQNATYLPPIPGMSPSPVTSAVGFNENSTLPFVPGRTYRLRVINTSAFSAFFFWIDGHDMRIIEVDGTDVQESPIDVLSISAAQRYSVLVEARNDTSSNWLIHANMDTDMFDKVPSTLNPNITSSITYAAGESITDLGPISDYGSINDTALVPTIPVPQPPATKTIDLEFMFDTMNDGTNRGMMNGVVYNSPLVPAIMSELSLGSNATVQEAYGPYSYMLDHLEVVDIVIKNADKGMHPFHLHGHKFQIVNRADQYNSTDPALNPPLVEGQANPMRRDTVAIPAGSSVTLRVVADNPGAWLLHCHVEWHLQAGLAVQFIEAPIQAQERAVGQVPSFIYDQCAALGNLDSGNAAGHASATDLSGLPLGPYQQKLGWLTKGILAMTGCVLTAVIGMLTVMWYSMGTGDSEEEMEQEARRRMETKEKRGRLFGLFKKTT
ncbi:multicopper oxidase [Hydnomerulius pinastri MD-312]|uniref:Multicopper oxidase n=1 Tax=Hydnomerulius pinastri MD-312 TaxID=994086 RepID=A0A0C9WBQ6_9AGAM|nr:multicopper oxidase [Hydnomerulius pinastri MD-312]